MEANLFCQWGGVLMKAGNDVEYTGGKHKFIFISEEMNFCSLLNKLYGVIGVDEKFVELKVQMRYPMIGNFKAIPLDDDDSLKAMWFVMKQNSGSAMQLYIEQYPRNNVFESEGPSYSSMDSSWSMPSNIPSLNSNVGIGSFTQMFMAVGNVHDNLSVLHSPSHAQVPTTSSGNPIHVNDLDALGIDEPGKDNDEDAMEANERRLQASAPSPFFNNVAEINPTLVDDWRTWAMDSTFTPGGEFAVGQQFNCLKDLKDAVKSYSITRNQSIRVLESEPEKYVVECKRKKECNCMWRLRATKDHVLSTFKIVKYSGPHASNCLSDMNSFDHPLLTSEFVGNVILELIRLDPSFKIRAIVEYVKDKYNYTISYKRAWLAKQKVVALIFGDREKSYQELPSFMHALAEANPGSVVHFQTTPTNSSNRGKPGHLGVTSNATQAKATTQHLPPRYRVRKRRGSGRSTEGRNIIPSAQESSVLHSTPSSSTSTPLTDPLSSTPSTLVAPSTVVSPPVCVYERKSRARGSTRPLHSIPEVEKSNPDSSSTMLKRPRR